MAEYLSASPGRRRSIIQEARFPKVPVTARYAGARDGLVKFLGDGSRSISHLARAREKLMRRASKEDASDWTQQDCAGSTEALDAFQRAYNKLTLLQLDCREPAGRLPLLEFGPTKVSVSLDLTLHRPTDDGPDDVGGTLFVFSRGSTPKVRKERSTIMAGLIYVFCDRYLAGMGTPDPKLCFAVDVFGGIMHPCPGSFVRGLRNVQEACEEIADRWRRVEPPDDYDGPIPN